MTDRSKGLRALHGGPSMVSMFGGRGLKNCNPHRVAVCRRCYQSEFVWPVLTRLVSVTPAWAVERFSGSPQTFALCPLFGVYIFQSFLKKKKWISLEPHVQYGLIIPAQQTHNVMSLLEHLHVLAVESYLEETFSRQTQSQFTFCMVYVFTSANWNTAYPSGREV